MICELKQHIPNFYILKGALNIPATFLDLFVTSRHFLTPILYLLMADSLKCSFKRLNLIIVLSTLKATLILPWQQTNWPIACCFTLCNVHCIDGKNFLLHDVMSELWIWINFPLSLQSRMKITKNCKNIKTFALWLQLVPFLSFCQSAAYNDWSSACKTLLVSAA